MSSGIDAGAHAPAGGGRMGDRGYFVEPTVLTETTPDMKVVREEIFGPVVCAIPFDSEDDNVIERGNATNSASRRGSGPATSTRRTGLPTACAPARCGSTATACSTPPCRSAATRSRAGAGRWATTRSRTTSRPSPWSPSWHSRRPTVQRPGPARRPGLRIAPPGAASNQPPGKRGRAGLWSRLLDARPLVLLAGPTSSEATRRSA